jgi:LCP family protein required for cell wall assembly
MSGSNQGEDGPDYDRPGSGRGGRRDDPRHDDPRRDQPAPWSRNRPGDVPPTRFDARADDYAQGGRDGGPRERDPYRSDRAAVRRPAGQRGSDGYDDRYDDRYDAGARFDRAAGRSRPAGRGAAGYGADRYGGRSGSREHAGDDHAGYDDAGYDHAGYNRDGGDGYEGDGYDRDDDRDGYGPDRYGSGGYPPPPTAEPDDPALPAGPPDGPPRPARSVARFVAGAIALVVLAVSVSGWSLLHHYNGRVRHIALAIPGKRPPEAARGVHNMLLVGSDTRAGTNGQFGQVDGQRSDTTMLAHLSPDGATTMLSFPRDLLVTIPAYTDSAGRAHPAQRSKLNAAFSYGGPSLLVRTIEALTNIRIDNYVQIDFVGFQTMTDALGGVTVCVKALPPSLKAQGFDNLNDKMSGWHGQVGLNMLNGQQALAFVRQRYGLPGSDLDRIRRQQQFIGAVFRESLSSSTLLNPSKVVHLLNAATSALTVDAGTSLTDLRVLALHLRAVDNGGVTFATVPANPGSAGGQSVLIVDRAGLAAQLHTLTGSTGSSGSSALPARATATGAVPMRLVAAQAPLGGAGAADEAAAASSPAMTPASGSCTY